MGLRRDIITTRHIIVGTSQSNPNSSEKRGRNKNEKHDGVGVVKKVHANFFVALQIPNIQVNIYIYIYT